MPKVKFTKTELKKQRDHLKQYKRFLPTLQMKKQLLQVEMRHCQEQLERNIAEEEKAKASLVNWIGFFSEEGLPERLAAMIAVKNIDVDKKNIAGVEVPVFKAVRVEIAPYDLFSEELWLDNAVESVCKIIELRAEYKVVEEQRRLLSIELKTTSQRVNLFEKVKIPECTENIRAIQIYLGDMDVAAVGRSKIAKRKTQEAVA